jgi:hypothetical protein
MKFADMGYGPMGAVAFGAPRLGDEAAELEERASGASRHEQTGFIQPLVVDEVEACRILGMKQRTLYALEAKGKLPFAKSLNRKVRRYDVAGMIEWNKRQRSKAAG